MHDVRYAIRALRKQPVFSLVVVLTLALGIGANTAIFSLLYQILLRPLPYANADRLVFVWNSYPRMGLPQASVSIPDYLDRRTGAPSVEDATLFTMTSMVLSQGAEPEQLRALMVTPSFFSTLGRTPLVGRAFAEADATTGADHFVVLTHGLWQSRFGGERSIVGRDVRLNGEPYSVVGVLPADVELPSVGVSLLVPFSFTPAQMADTARGNEFSQMIARLRPGATIEQLDAQMRTIVSQTSERLPERRPFVESSGFTARAVPIRQQLVGDVRTPLYVLQAGVIVVLLIACANIANLLLMRATGRGHELAVRVALGAGRWRLIQQMLAESFVLAAFGGALGLVLGMAGVRALLAASPTELPLTVGNSLQLPVLAFAAALTSITGVVFGIAPAVSVLRGNARSRLNDEGARSSATRGISRTRATLVVIETALALVLLVGAGLLVKSFARLRDVNPGFSAERVLTAQIGLPQSRYPDLGARRTFWERLVEKASAMPGVVGVGVTSNVPFNGMVSSGSYSIVGYTPPAGEVQPHGRQEVVGGDYFRTMQIPLVAGRLFDDTDRQDGQPVVIVDQYLANRYFAGRDPIGQQIRRGGPTSPAFTIVGVVGTINSIDLGEPVMKERLYYPLAQAVRPAMGLVVKTAVEPRALARQVREAVRSIDSEQAVADLRTMEEWVGRSLVIRRTPTMLLALFGGVALLLAALGIYGMLAFGVAQRERELGIRQALGADRRDIVSLVVGQGLRMTSVGMALGLVGAVALTRYLSAMLFEVGARDLSVFGAVAALLLTVALAACYLPARRASAVDPIAALRET
jgi:putative ABC transport system permease protein